MRVLQRVEAERGRERPYVNAPRTLDLDLILCGDDVVETADLVVPHPRFRERAFVLEPLAVVAPGIVDPVTTLTARELLARLWYRVRGVRSEGGTCCSSDPVLGPRRGSTARPGAPPWALSPERVHREASGPAG